MNPTQGNHYKNRNQNGKRQSYSSINDSRVARLSIQSNQSHQSQVSQYSHNSNPIRRTCSFSANNYKMEPNSSNSMSDFPEFSPFYNSNQNPALSEVAFGHPYHNPTHPNQSTNYNTSSPQLSTLLKNLKWDERKQFQEHEWRLEMTASKVVYWNYTKGLGTLQTTSGSTVLFNKKEFKNHIWLIYMLHLLDLPLWILCYHYGNEHKLVTMDTYCISKYKKVFHRHGISKDNYKSFMVKYYITHGTLPDCYERILCDHVLENKASFEEWIFQDNRGSMILQEEFSKKSTNKADSKLNNLEQKSHEVMSINLNGLKNDISKTRQYSDFF